MRILFVLLVVGMLTGCATVPPPSAPVATPNPSRVKPERVGLTFDNPADVFAPVFKEPHWFAKLETETEVQYRQRLTQTGGEGKQVTFLIPAELCEVYRHADSGTYSVVTKDRLTSDRHEQSAKKWAITLGEREGRKLLVRLEGFDRLPSALRWRDQFDAGLVHFGLPIRSSDTAVTTLLAGRKAGLAIRGKIGNLATSGESAEAVILPFLLEDAYLYDTVSQSTIMHWSSKP